MSQPEIVADSTIKIIVDALRAAGISGVKITGNVVEFPLVSGGVVIKVEVIK